MKRIIGYVIVDNVGNVLKGKLYKYHGTANNIATRYNTRYSGSYTVKPTYINK